MSSRTSRCLGAIGHPVADQPVHHGLLYVTGLASVRPLCMTESERRQREDARRSDAAETVALPMALTLVLLPFVGAVTAVIALVAGLVTPLAAVAATLLVTLQLRAVEYNDNHRSRPGRWSTLARVASLPFTIAPGVASRAAMYPILSGIVMFVGATIVFWWPAVVLAVCDRMFRRIL